MKTTIFSTVCAASLLALSAQDVHAQQRRPASSFGSTAIRPARCRPIRLRGWRWQWRPARASGFGGPAGDGRGGQPRVGGGLGRPAPAMGPMQHSVVAVIDLNHVMNNYVNAKKQVEGLQKDGMAADTNLRKDNAQIEALKEKLKDFKPGSPDYKRMEEEITQRISDLKVRASIEQRDFQERQMKAMYKIYGEISEEVKRYAQANGVLLVMDYSSDPVDPNVPATIQRAVSRPFVYQGGPDITDAVLNALNQRKRPRQPAGRPALVAEPLVNVDAPGLFAARRVEGPGPARPCGPGLCKSLANGRLLGCTLFVNNAPSWRLSSSKVLGFGVVATCAWSFVRRRSTRASCSCGAIWRRSRGSRRRCRTAWKPRAAPRSPAVAEAWKWSSTCWPL